MVSFTHEQNSIRSQKLHWRKMSDWSIPNHVTWSKIQHGGKVVPRVFIPGERRKTGALLGGICLNGLDFLLFSFSSCSCEIRLLQCLRFGLLDATFNSLTGHVSKEENAVPAKQTSKIRTFPRGALHHECITVLNASKYCTGLLLDNPTGP